jgi:hypothetical protein
VTGKVYIEVTKGGAYRRRASGLTVFVLVISAFLFILLSLFTRSVYDDAKAEFVERLSRQKKVVEINKTLKTELFAVTQKGYMELAAHERLGLKRPKDEEVVVLR